MCYVKGCTKECDKYVKAACLDYLTKEQAELKLEIRIICNVCFRRMVQAKYRDEEIQLCTNCNNILNELQRGMVV